MRRQRQPGREVLGGQPSGKVDAVFTDQFQRQARSQSVDLGQVHPKDGVKGAACIQARRIGLACLLSGGRKRVGRWWRALSRPLEHGLDLLVTSRHFRLMVTAQVAGGSRNPEICDQPIWVGVQGLQDIPALLPRRRQQRPDHRKIHRSVHRAEAAGDPFGAISSSARPVLPSCC
jgi:hypothetical protein